MSRPFSRRTLLTAGKIHEIAEACRKADIDAALFVNTLTPVQRTALANLLGCPALSATDLDAPGDASQRQTLVAGRTVRRPGRPAVAVAVGVGGPDGTTADADPVEPAASGTTAMRLLA
jgi:hypothetical protein